MITRIVIWLNRRKLIINFPCSDNTQKDKIKVETVKDNELSR